MRDTDQGAVFGPFFVSSGRSRKIDLRFFPRANGRPVGTKNR
jgi:hypothetical protein